jgi:hypothetical protein
MPQPLSRVNPNATLIIGNNCDNPSDHRPEIALLAIKVIAEWSILESFLQGLFVKLLGSNPALGAAMYSSLSGTSARRDAFRAVAKLSLSPEELEIFDAIFSLYITAAKQRNNVAHWVWGYSPQIPDGVILCNPNVFMDFNVRIEQFTAALIWEEKVEFPQFNKDQVFVFYAHDFTGMSERIQRLMHFVSLFKAVAIPAIPTTPANQDRTLFLMLSHEPEILEYVSRLHQRQKSNS